MSVTIINQLTPYTCVLACLESYFEDIQKPKTQCEILKDCFAVIKNPTDERKDYGAISDVQVVALAAFLGFQAGLFMDFRQNHVEPVFIDALKNNKGVLISANWNGQSQHCVRLSGVKANGIYEVMCPMFGSQKSTLLDVTFVELVQWGFRYVLIQ